MNKSEKEKIGLYLHFPFCRRKCDYCDFYSVVPSAAGQIDMYVQALAKHMETLSGTAKSYLVDSVFMGGGTPSVVSAPLMNKLMQCMRGSFDLSPDCEITIEANPATVTPESLKLYREAGINRISIGFQSANDKELVLLSRLHTKDDFTLSYNQARDAGFENINIDVMFGIPQQTYQSFMETLEYVTGLEPEHISVYGLKIEDGTPLSKQNRESLFLPDEDTEFRMYLGCIDFLREKGYHQYEISNFAKAGRECRHNLKYWNCDKYLGLGTSAHSYFNGDRFAYVSDVKKYTEHILSGGVYAKIITQTEKITKQSSESEYIMLRMRLCAGLDADRFFELYGKDFRQKYGSRFEAFIKDGYASYDGKCYTLTPKGMLISNYILSSIIDF